MYLKLLKKTMDSSNKKVLFINLEKKSFETKGFPDLNKYIGGVGVGIKLFQNYQDLNPLIFSVGPLNGFFPFASKTAVILKNDKEVEDVYLGGYLSTRIKFSDLDSVLIYGKSKDEVVLNIENNQVDFLPADVEPKDLGLPGKKSYLTVTNEEAVLDGYFVTQENYLFKNLEAKNLKGFCITGTKTYTPPNIDKYTQLYKTLLARVTDLTVERGFFPSCSGCPVGCEESKVGEAGGNILVHSLVGCQFAEKVFSDIGTVFSCLNNLGYDYTHEDIENLPSLVQDCLQEIN